MRLGGIALTDHTSWAGVREAAGPTKGRVLVAPGAEIKTYKGELLTLLVTNQIAAGTFQAMVDQIRVNLGPKGI